MKSINFDQANTIQINPFAFSPETDARFFLLIGLIILSTLGLIYTLMAGIVFKESYFPPFAVATCITLFIFVRVWYLARQDACERIQTKGWQKFPPDYSGDSYKEMSLQRMNCYIHQIVESIPNVKKMSPKFVWDEKGKNSERPTGMAFGFNNQKFVCLRKGLHTAFIKERDKFKAVLLHELGHLENQDVNKTIFSIALGRVFFPTMLIVILALDIYWLWSIVENIVSNQSLEASWEGGEVILLTNLKAILLLPLVEMTRSSVLRVREYYADARARVWMGKPNAFLNLFQTSKESSPKEETNKQNLLITLWRIIVEKFKKYLAPLHPTNKQRVNILLNPHELLQPNYEISFLAGLLSGLSLNLSFLILTVVYPALWDSLEKFVDGTSQNWMVLIISLLILAGTTLVFFICALVPIVVFGCIPIANSVGLQLQASTVVDNTSISQKHYTRIIQLAILSFFISLGFILGCLLSSTAVPFSLALIPSTFLLVLPKLPFFIGLWGCVFLIWMLPLRGIAGRLYSKHIGDKIPRNKQKFLTLLSILALFPTFVGLTIIHIILNYRTLCPDSFRYFCPESLSTQYLVFWLILISLLSLLLQAIVWGVGWLVMRKRGWLKPIHCPNCDIPIDGKITVNQICPSCEYPLRKWLQSPSSLSLPPLPPLAISPSENAPPL